MEYNFVFDHWLGLEAQIYFYTKLYLFDAFFLFVRVEYSLCCSCLCFLCIYTQASTLIIHMNIVRNHGDKFGTIKKKIAAKTQKFPSNSTNKVVEYKFCHITYTTYLLLLLFK